jgi:hypothetical protein
MNNRTYVYIYSMMSDETTVLRTRVCVRCNVEKTEDKFHVTRGKINSLSCRICKNLKRRETYPKKVTGFLKLTDEKQAKIIREFQAHIPATVIARSNGIEYRTLMKWKYTGQIAIST